MRTEAQIQASRLNGAKSRGPVTAAGKLNSSRNATRNGLIARSFALKVEDSAQFQQSLDQLCAEFQPSTSFEHSLVTSIGSAMWEQERIRCAKKVTIDIQTAIERANPPEYEHGAAALTSAALRTLADTTRVLDSLNRQDARLDRQYQRAVRLLMDLRKGGPHPSPPCAAGPALEPAPLAPEVFPDEEPVSLESAPEPDATGFVGMLPSQPCEENNSQNEPNKLLKTNNTHPAPIPGTRAVCLPPRAFAASSDLHGPGIGESWNS